MVWDLSYLRGGVVWSVDKFRGASVVRDGSPPCMRRQANLDSRWWTHFPKVIGCFLRQTGEEGRSPGSEVPRDAVAGRWRECGVGSGERRGADATAVRGGGPSMRKDGSTLLGALLPTASTQAVWESGETQVSRFQRRKLYPHWKPKPQAERGTEGALCGGHTWTVVETDDYKPCGSPQT